MGMARGLGAFCTVLSTLLAASSACSGEPTPEDKCKDWLSLTSDCYARAGKQIGVNPAACEDESLLTDQINAQISCSLQYRDIYCSTVTGAASGDAAAIDFRSPDVVRYQACLSSSVAVSPCKEAIQTMADCGVAFGLSPQCDGQMAALARCVLDHKEGACSLNKPREAGGLTAAESAFQQCQIDASQAARDASTD
jgi:hypothetical protein